MPKSEIQQERVKLNKLRRTNPGNPVIQSRTNIIRAQLDRMDKGDARPELIREITRQVAELEIIMRARRLRE